MLCYSSNGGALTLSESELDSIHQGLLRPWDHQIHLLLPRPSDDTRETNGPAPWQHDVLHLPTDHRRSPISRADIQPGDTS